MPGYWITTHWPVPETDLPFSRHVYVKEHSVRLPEPGANIFIRETIHAIGKDKKPIRTVTRKYRGQQTQFEVRTGSGGIIGTAIVSGKLRPIQDQDVVFDFGDLDEWSIIPCDRFKPAYLSLDALLKFLHRKNPRFLSLWHMPDKLGPELMNTIQIDSLR
jgi:hypothetical protein